MPETITPEVKVEADPFASLHAVLPEPPKAEPKVETPPEEKQPEAKVDPKVEPKAEPKVADKPKAIVKEEPRALREKLEASNKSQAEMQAKITDYEAKIADYEARGKDTSLLVEKLTKAEQSLAEKEAAIRALRHEESPEFKAKYQKPLDDAVADAAAEINQLNVLDADGNPVSRADFKKHFSALYGLDRAEAKARAKQLFGDEADIVMTHWTELHRLQRQYDRALDEERAQATQKQEAERIQFTRNNEAAAALFVKLDKELQEKYPDYRDDIKDTEASKVRAEGFKLFDAKPTTLQERVIKDAHVRHMIGAFPVHKLQIQRLTAERDAALAKLAEREKSAPGGPTNRASDVKPSASADRAEGFDKDLAALLKAE